MKSLFDSHSGRIEKFAEFSVCKRYRYTLSRRWSDAPLCNFVMLNPSTADAFKNDPTVERCERRAREMGYGGLIVTNLFAWRATDPADMKAATDPIGPLNNESIIASAHACELVICAWGNHGRHMDRSAAVAKMLFEVGIDCHALAFNSTGQPKHPLYVGYNERPQLWFKGNKINASHAHPADDGERVVAGDRV